MKISKEVIGQLIKAANNQRALAEAVSDQRDNPSVAPTYHKACGRAEAFQAVLDALNGQSLDLKSFSTEQS